MIARKKRIGLALVAILGIAMVAPSIIADLNQQPPPPPPPDDDVPVLDISSIPALVESLMEGGGYFVTIAPEVVVLLVNMIAGFLAMDMGPDELTAMVTDLVRVLIVTMPSWPPLTPFHPAWIAELPTIIYAIIDVLPGILEALPRLLPTLIAALPEMMISILNVVAEEIHVLVDIGMWIEIALSYFIALPDFIYAILTGLGGLLNQLPEMVSLWIDTFEGEWVGILLPFAEAVPDFASAIMDWLAGAIRLFPETVFAIFNLVLSFLVVCFSRNCSSPTY